MKWVHVTFTACKTRANIPCSFIKNHEKLEISVNKIYDVFWSPNQEDTPEDILKKNGKILCFDKIKRRNNSSAIPAYYKAAVHLIADSEEELAESIENKRVVINYSTEVEEASLSITTDKKQVLKEAAKRNTESLLVNKPKKGKYMHVNISEDESDEEYVPNWEITNMKNTIEMLEEKLQKAEEDKNKAESRNLQLNSINCSLEAKLLKEQKKNEQLTNLNINYQMKLLNEKKLDTNEDLSRASQESRTSHSQAIEHRQETFQIEVNRGTDRTTEQARPANVCEVINEEDCFNAMVQNYINLTQFQRIQKSVKPGKDGDGMFVKNLAAAIWTPAELCERSATGLACPSKREEVARQECTPEKKAFIENLLRNRIKKDAPNEDVTARLKKMTSYLSQKISTLRRDTRNKLQN